VRGQKEIS